MNEWYMVFGMIAAFGVVFGIFWKITMDVKESLSDRVQNCEHVIDNMATDCARKKEDFITTKAFDRFENHLTNRFDGLDTNITGLTKRIDDLVLTVRSGKVT